MHKVRILLAAAAIAAGLIPIVAAPALASCAAENIVMYENNSLDPGGLGTAKQLCVSTPNLDQVAHTQPGFCKSQFFRFTDSWNDCVSSFRVTLPANRCIRMYQDANYLVPLAPIIAGPTNALFRDFVAAANDRMTSFKFYNKVNGFC
jgi:hypothetical protein